MSDAAEERKSRFDEDVANLVYHCRMKAAAYSDEEREQYLDALAEGLNNLRTGFAQTG